jgi:thiosulfate dehydrogenase [quinone] large subunit
MKGFFNMLADNPLTVNIIDQLNIWGLILIGLSLILGFLSRPAIISGIILLAMYYLSHPPFVGIRYAVPSEGSYLIINKTLIELIALCVLYVFPSSNYIGFDRFIFKRK